MGRLIGMLGALFAYFCIATVLTATILGVYGLASGKLGPKQVEQIAAVLHGVDLTARGAASSDAKDKPKSEQPSFEAVTERRAMRWQEFELREKIVQDTLNELRTLQVALAKEKDRFAKFAEAFQHGLNEQEQKAQDEGRRAFQALVENMKPKQAKEQLLLQYKAGKTDVVVETFRDMEEAKRAKIIAEFKDTTDAQILADILDRIRRNPKQTLIEQTRQKVNTPDSH